jgi:hypothetical protein
MDPLQRYDQEEQALLDLILCLQKMPTELRLLSDDDIARVREALKRCKDLAAEIEAKESGDPVLPQSGE